MFTARALLLILSVSASIAFRLDDSNISSEKYRRVIVVSDMHGDSQALIQSLYLGYKDILGRSAIPLRDFAERILTAARFPSRPVDPLYTAGDVALIQMGDLVDRGKYSRTCVALMNATQAVTGFKTITLMGNHELFALLGEDLYDQLVHPEDDLVRNPVHFERPHGGMWKHMTTEMIPMVRWGPPLSSAVSRSPVDPSSTATLFVHAGVTEEFLYRFNIVPAPSHYDEPSYPFEPHLMRHTPLSNGSVPISTHALNQMIYEDLQGRPLRESADKYTYDWSPFTTRSYGELDVDCASIDVVLALFDVSRVVVGHIPSLAHRVRTNCDGKIILSDIGASRFMLTHEPSSPSFPGIVLFNASSPAVLESISAQYLHVDNSRIFSEFVWDHRGYSIQSLKEWARDHHHALTCIPPAIDGTPRSSFYEEMRSAEGDDNPVDLKRRRLTTDEDSCASTTPKMSRSIRIMETLFEDENGKIEKAVVNGVAGFIINYSSEDAFHLSEYLFEEVFAGPSGRNFPSMHDLSENSVAASLYQYRKFLETDASVLLSFYDEDELTVQIVDQMDTVIDTLHSNNVCLGLSSLEALSPGAIMSFFVINLETETVELINMSRLKLCWSSDELIQERKMFAQHFIEFFDSDK